MHTLIVAYYNFSTGRSIVAVTLHTYFVEYNNVSYLRSVALSIWSKAYLCEQRPSIRIYRTVWITTIFICYICNTEHIVITSPALFCAHTLIKCCNGKYCVEIVILLANKNYGLFSKRKKMKRKTLCDECASNLHSPAFNQMAIWFNSKICKLALAILILCFCIAYVVDLRVVMCDTIFNIYAVCACKSTQSICWAIEKGRKREENKAGYCTKLKKKPLRPIVIFLLTICMYNSVSSVYSTCIVHIFKYIIVGCIWKITTMTIYS